MVGTYHTSGELHWLRLRLWLFLYDISIFVVPPTERGSLPSTFGVVVIVFKVLTELAARDIGFASRKFVFVNSAGNVVVWPRTRRTVCVFRDDSAEVFEL